MNEELSELIEVLSQFISQFESSGKPETAKYYQSLLDLVNEDAGSTKILDSIINSGSISQYANLNFEEDELLDKLHEKALNLKRANLERG